jgi:hypothetical protein
MFHNADFVIGKIRRLRFLRVLSWTIVPFFVAALSLEFGLWTRFEIITGPFTPETQNSAVYVAPIGADIPFKGLFDAHGDNLGGLTQSDLRLWINGESWMPPHTAHVRIERGERGGFLHWGRYLYFALPISIANDPNTVLVVEYSVQVKHWLYNLLLLSTALILLMQATIMYLRRSRNMSRQLLGIVLLIGFLFQVLSWIVIAASVFYIITIIYGWYAGYALPSTALFKLFPITENFESSGPAVLLIFAGCGAAFTWLGALNCILRRLVRLTEVKLLRLWGCWGLPVIISIMLYSLSSGGWSGHIRLQDLNYQSVLGLVPHSDARAYFTDAFHQAYWGRWDTHGSRRPIGQAFRQVTVFLARYSYTGTLLIQLLIVAGLTYMAARSVALWRGIWAGMAFSAFIYIVARPFLSTTLTEPLGLAWALFSVIFLVESVRMHSASHALIALTAVTFALLTRMGSMFTIPLLALWVAFGFGGIRKRARFAAACGAVAAVLILSAALEFSYGSSKTTEGANFAYTACGLTMGTDWSDCATRYQTELNKFPDEIAAASFLFSIAWENALQAPSLLINKLWTNLSNFVTQLPEFLSSGYGSVSANSFAERVIRTPAGFLMLLPGLFYTLRYRASFAERSLWLTLGISIALSAAVILADDGWRALTATFPFVACFAALGFSAPGAVVVHATRPVWKWEMGVVGIVVAVILFLFIPLLSHVLAWKQPDAPSRFMNSANEHIVPGEGRISGFIVIPDGASESLSIPTLHLSQFIKLMTITNMEDDFGPFLKDIADKVPFAFVVGGRLDAENQSNIYIAPPKVLEQKDTRAWHFWLASPEDAPWRVLRYVVAAEKVP